MFFILTVFLLVLISGCSQLKNTNPDEDSNIVKDLAIFKESVKGIISKPTEEDLRRLNIVRSAIVIDEKNLDPSISIEILTPKVIPVELVKEMMQLEYRRFPICRITFHKPDGRFFVWNRMGYSGPEDFRTFFSKDDFRSFPSHDDPSIANIFGKPIELVVHDQGYIPGEVVTFRLMYGPVYAREFKEVAICPRPLIAQNASGEIVMKAVLISYLPTAYSISITEMNPQEEFEFITNSGIEGKKFRGGVPISFIFTPEETDGRIGGETQIELSYKTGNAYTMQIPWGTKLEEYEREGVHVVYRDGRPNK